MPHTTRFPAGGRIVPCAFLCYTQRLGMGQAYTSVPRPFCCVRAPSPGAACLKSARSSSQRIQCRAHCCSTVLRAAPTQTSWVSLDVLVSTDLNASARPPVLLLHGFPDSRKLWDAQVACLERAGFSVVVPSLPGFGDSDCPAEVGAYSLPSLLKVVMGLLDQLGVEKVVVVGHDWGASLAWFLAMRASERVLGLVALSVGHAGALFGGGGMLQRMQSWYMLFFLHKPAAENALRAVGWELFKQMFPVGQNDQQDYITALSRPGRLTAALNLYRANVRPESFGATRYARFPQLALPVMGVWSSGDPALTEAQMVESGRYVAPGKWRYERLEGCGHWIPREAPDALNALLLDFLAKLQPARAAKL